MFTPQIIIAAMLAVATSLCMGFYTGQNWANTKYEAQRAKEQAAYRKALDTQIKRGNELSDKLAKAEARITVKTVEVIKYVPTVTTGTTPCLSPAAVSLLQPGSAQGIRPPASEPATEGAGALAASDRDVAYWIAEANQLYDTCALRLNTLVLWHAAE